MATETETTNASTIQVTQISPENVEGLLSEALLGGWTIVSPGSAPYVFHIPAEVGIPGTGFVDPTISPLTNPYVELLQLEAAGQGFVPEDLTAEALGGTTPQVTPTAIAAEELAAIELAAAQAAANGATNGAANGAAASMWGTTAGATPAAGTAATPATDTAAPPATGVMRVPNAASPAVGTANGTAPATGSAAAPATGVMRVPNAASPSAASATPAPGTMAAPGTAPAPAAGTMAAPAPPTNGGISLPGEAGNVSSAGTPQGDIFPFPDLVRVHGSIPHTQTIPQIPEVFPEQPTYMVPGNPLLPPEFQEILSYEDLQYMNGFLRTQIGRYVKVDFLIGTTQIVSKIGKLLAVGLTYVVIQDILTNDVVVCDYFSIKFATFDYPAPF